MMKRAIGSVVGVALVGLFTASAYAAIDPGTIAGAWLFDEGSGDIAGDSSGNGNDGTLDGGVEWVDGPGGNSGSAVKFDGSGFVGVPDADSLDMGDAITVMFWVRSEKEMLDMWADRQVVVGKHYLEYEIGIYIDAQIHTYSSDQAGNYDEGILAGFGGKLPGGEGDWIQNEWYHVAWTLDGAHEIAYVNGVMVGEYDKGHVGTVGGDHALEIGRRTEGGLNVTGSVDEVAVFSVALGEADIVDAFENGLGAAIGLTAVEAGGKLAATWGALKTR